MSHVGSGLLEPTPALQPMKIQAKAGFTLIELMIVIGIIAILAAIAIPNYVRYTLRSRQTEAITLLNMIKTGEYTFYAAHDCYARTEQMPAVVPSNVPNPWSSARTNYVDPCDGVIKSFEDLGVAPHQGLVYMVYQCEASLRALGAPTDDITCSVRGDLDADLSEFELLYCTDADGDGVGLPSPGPSGVVCTFPDEPIRVSQGVF